MVTIGRRLAQPGRLALCALGALFAAGAVYGTPRAVPADAAGVTVDDADAAIAYTGAWVSARGPAAVGAGSRSACGVGASASYRFTGGALTVYYVAGPDRAILNVKLDGSAQPPIDQYAATPVGRSVAYQLKAGTHTVLLTNSGQRNAAARGWCTNLDGFGLAASPTATATPTVATPTRTPTASPTAGPALLTGAKPIVTAAPTAAPAEPRLGSAFSPTATPTGLATTTTAAGASPAAPATPTATAAPPTATSTATAATATPTATRTASPSPTSASTYVPWWEQRSASGQRLDPGSINLPEPLNGPLPNALGTPGLLGGPPDPAGGSPAAGATGPIPFSERPPELGSSYQGPMTGLLAPPSGPLGAAGSAPAERAAGGPCPPALHAAYVTTGPDGLPYPTWHPRVDPSGCAFDHDHGDDPRTSLANPGPPAFGYLAALVGLAEPHSGFKVRIASQAGPEAAGQPETRDVRLVVQTAGPGALRSVMYDLVAGDGQFVHLQGLAEAATTDPAACPAEQPAEVCAAGAALGWESRLSVRDGEALKALVSVTSGPNAPLAGPAGPATDDCDRARERAAWSNEGGETAYRTDVFGNVRPDGPLVQQISAATREAQTGPGGGCDLAGR